MKYDNQLRYAVQMIETFHGNIPLHAWLKQYFRENKQMGSRDRKQVAGMIYSFYRLGKAEIKLTIPDRILLGLFLCHQEPSDLLQYFKPEWNSQIGIPFEQKLTLLDAEHIQFKWTSIFPWKNKLSASVNHSAYSKSFLVQPDLFIRVRPGHKQKVIEKIESAKIPHEWIGPDSLRLSNGLKVEELFTLNKEIVVQDYNSQRTAEYFPSFSASTAATIIAWDACAASGGKSILLFDQYPAIDLYATDIRPSIISNLRTRFKEAGINHYHAFVADLSAPETSLPIERLSLDLILIDAPCSGSGTWSRNPDEAYFFQEAALRKFVTMQRKIIATCVPKLKPGGKLIYITCSVFKEENEAAVKYIVDEQHLHLEKMEVLAGYHQKSDSMFVARFTA
jgi:16S rRNA (cytosine967-C5)-methyltransferase